MNSDGDESSEAQKSSERLSEGTSADGWKNPSSEEIKDLLSHARRIAVVGLSPDPARPSNGVAAYLLDQGYEIVPINPRVSEVFGLPSYPDLASAPGPFDIVDVFRRSDSALDIVRQALNVEAPAIWLQEGVISPEAFALGRSSGCMMIMDRCILKEHSRLVNN